MLPKNNNGSFSFELIFNTVLTSTPVSDYAEHAELLRDYFGDTCNPLMDYLSTLDVSISFSVSLINETPQLAFRLVNEESLDDSTFLLSEMDEKNNHLVHNFTTTTHACLFPETPTIHKFNATHPSMIFQKLKGMYGEGKENVSDESAVRLSALVENHRRFFRMDDEDLDRSEKASSALTLIHEQYQLSLISFLLVNKPEALSLEFLKRKNILPGFPIEWAKELIL